MKKYIYILWILSILTFSLAAQETEDAHLKQLKVLKETVQATQKNSFGTSITVYSTLNSLEGFLDQFESLISSREFKNSEAKNSPIIQDIYKEIYMIALGGRGNTTSKDGTGWYYTKNSSDVDNILTHIQRQKAFDKNGLSSLIENLNSLDPESDSFSVSKGFPPKFEILSEGELNNIIENLKRASVRDDYDIPVKSKELSLIANLIDDTKLSPDEKKALKGFVQSSEKNIYDGSIKTLNNAGEDFIEYYGRKSEKQEIMEALSRLEKGHILLTGKAGVGKTTILKMIQDALVNGDISITDEASPIILELPITDITNDSDPTVIKQKIDMAADLAEALDRRIILYVDEAHIASKMTKNAIKGALTDKLDTKKLHFIWSTTSTESKAFLSDKAFSRRWSKVHVPEFSEKESIELVKLSFVKQWQKHHVNQGVEFGSITEKAFEFAARHYRFEQPDAANPTGMKEFLEGAIARKKRILVETKTRGKFDIDLKDLRDYLKSRSKMDLIPGDEDFDIIFKSKMNALREEYVGNEYYLRELEKSLYSFFSKFKRKKIPSIINFGAPGVGKTYIAELVAKHFFDNGIKVLNGAEYANGGFEVNKLIGPPPGLVGYTDNGGELTNAAMEFPAFILVVEEGDYVHKDFMRFMTNMITKMEIDDTHGVNYKLDRMMIMINSNKGQEFMVAPNSKNKMNWTQFGIRKSGLVDRIVQSDGTVLERPKKEILGDIFDDFFKDIVANSDGNGGDTALVSQEAIKQKRRHKAMYVLSPDRKDLIEAGKRRIKKFVRDVMLDFEIELTLDESHAEKLLELDKYDFVQAYTYVENMLDDRIFRKVEKYFSKEGISLKVDFDFETSKGIVMNISGDGIDDKIHLEDRVMKKKSPWASSDVMMNNIKNLSSNMSKKLLGMNSIVKDIQSTLKAKVGDWDFKTGQVLLGTTGNGKTELGKVLAQELFGTDDAWKKIEASHPHHLNEYFRPPKAYAGANEETDFERWVKARKNAGGGVIILDEILSLDGLAGQALHDKIAVFNKLYTFLDEQILTIGSETIDMRAFIPIITGNSLQSLFDMVDDTPESEKLVEFILDKVYNEGVALDYFASKGLDPPKLGRVIESFHLVGPLRKEFSLKIARIKVNSSIRKVKESFNGNVEVTYNDKIIEELVEKVSTVKLGMRKVNAVVKKLITSPLTSIGFDLDTDIKKIDISLNNDRIQWSVNGKEVEKTGDLDVFWEFKDKIESKEYSTPQFSDIEPPAKVHFSEQDIAEVAEHEGPGHWMTDTLLNGTNNSIAVNLNRGYMRPKLEKNLIKSLTSVFKEMIVLQAGNRAVIKKGLFAYGGGGEGKSDPNKARADDLGRVNEAIDNIAKNQLFEDYTEFTKNNDVFKLTLRNLSIYAADSVIDYGVKIGLDKDVREITIKDRYIGEEKLDEIAEKVLNGKENTLSKEEVYMQAIDDSINTVLAKSRKFGDKGVIESKAILTDLINKSLSELVYYNSDSEAKLKKIVATSLEKIKVFTANCDGNYEAQ